MILCKAAVRQGHRSRRVPRHPGRTADARHRRQGGLPGRGPDARLPSVCPADHRQRQDAGRGALGRRRPAGQRRHRQPPAPGRRHPAGTDRRRGREGPGPLRHHRQQEHDPLRPAEADGSLRHPHRHAGPDHPRHGLPGNADHRRLDPRSAPGPGRRGPARRGSAARCWTCAASFPCRPAEGIRHIRVPLPTAHGMSAYNGLHAWPPAKS